MTTTTATTNGSSNHDSTDRQIPKNAPRLLKIWFSVSESLPKIQLLGLDVNLTLATILFLTCLRQVFIGILIHLFAWPADSIRVVEAASSFVACFHSVNLVPALVLLFTQQPYQPSSKLSNAPLWWQTCVSALLQFCTGYMIYDGVLNILVHRQFQLSASDYLFLGHHVATALYMTSCRVLQQGHQTAMMCMLLGESTNPLHNLWYVSGFAKDAGVCCHSTVSILLTRAIEGLFCVAYCFMRAIVGPIVCLHMTVDLWWKRTIPIAIVIIWTLLIWAVIVGSKPWIDDCWRILMEDYVAGGLLGGASWTSSKEL
jgi:hypothetical protein